MSQLSSLLDVVLRAADQERLRGLMNSLQGERYGARQMGEAFTCE
jgi:hypothetical protein